MLTDWKIVLRQFARHPMVTIVAVATLAVGIGINTAMFSVLNAFIFRPCPYPESGQLVRVYRTDPQGQLTRLSPANFRDIQRENTVFAEMAAPLWNDANISEPGRPAEQVYALEVSKGFFQALGVKPELGRIFRQQEGEPGRPPVVVISHAFWKRHFGGDLHVCGRSLRIDGKPVTVVGVMPAGFAYPLLWRTTELWRPLYLSSHAWRIRDGFWMDAMARLKPGVSLAQAQTEMNLIAARLAHEYPKANARSGLRLIPFDAARTSPAGRRIEWLFMGLLGFVLLTACANLAGLQLTRMSARLREEAIRMALGASRAHLMRPRLIEGLLLSLGGGSGGLLLADVIQRWVGSRIVFGSTTGLSLPLDVRVVAFAAAASVVTLVIFAVVPALVTSRVDLNHALAQVGRGSTAGRLPQVIRRTLMVIEVAFAVVLLAGAGYCLRGFVRLTRREMGWQPHNLVTGNLYIPRQKYPGVAALGGFYDRILKRLMALPGTTHASVSWSAPIWGFYASNNVEVEGRPPPPPGQAPLVLFDAVTPDYFATVGINLLRGRGFTDEDRADTRRVVVINEAVARKFWPGENPIGKRIKANSIRNPGWSEVVGVVNDVQVASRFGAPQSRLQAYRPLAQEPGYWVAVAIRNPGPTPVLVNELRHAVEQVDPDQALFLVSGAENDVRRLGANFTLVGWILGGTSTFGLLIALLGIYGVLANLVVQRTREFGIRLALGAQAKDIRKLVAGDAGPLIALGMGAGIAGAWALARVLGATMPVAFRQDPVVLGGITFLTGIVSLLACWLPMRRISKIDAVVALRSE